MSTDALFEFTEYDTRIGAYGLIVDDRDRVLLARWIEGETPRWTLPGGGVELHETIPEAAVRELREETGYEVELGALLGVDSFTIRPDERLVGPGRWLKSVRIVFAATVIGGELRDEVGGSTDHAEWIPLADVPTLDRVELVDLALAMRR